MKIAFESDLLMPTVSKAISILTDRSKVCVDDVHYDEAKGIVEIYMQGKEITGFKTSFWGDVKPVYGQTMINSFLTIRQVEEINKEVDDRLVTDCNSCFTVLFGVKVDKNELYLGSAEEISGKTLCHILIKVKKISIEYSDEVEKSV